MRTWISSVRAAALWPGAVYRGRAVVPEGFIDSRRLWRISLESFAAPATRLAHSSQDLHRDRLTPPHASQLNQWMDRTIAFRSSAFHLVSGALVRTCMSRIRRYATAALSQKYLETLQSGNACSARASACRRQTDRSRYEKYVPISGIVCAARWGSAKWWQQVLSRPTKRRKNKTAEVGLVGVSDDIERTMSSVRSRFKRLQSSAEQNYLDRRFRVGFSGNYDMYRGLEHSNNCWEV